MGKPAAAAAGIEKGIIMTEYSIKHSDRTIPLEQIEQIVAAHGDITVIESNKNANYLKVDAESDVMDAFKAAHPDWKIYPVTHAEIPPHPPRDLEALRRRYGDDKKPKL
jgi:hypothetical protein